MGPHDREETALLDSLLLLDIGFSVRLLSTDQPNITGNGHIVALLVQEHGSPRSGEPEDQI